MRTISILKYTVTALILGAASTKLDNVPPGYGLIELEWEVEVSPGRVELFNGTVQEVHRQALAVNPDFQLLPSVQSRGELNRRSKVDCWRFAVTNRQQAEWNIDYLRRLSGKPTNGPGPGNCARVSCAWNAGIYWCNDNNYSKTIDGWSWIANSAQNIINVCHGNHDVNISGQNFEEGNWNTYISNANC
ncbi:hypothetical protein NLG97_g3107 [Lecanicillium saksenae]|uniref:Uncharacterized protein n=1 Tax=Lecanicillium saksenae TaxID=468837 RepID=A0ACC1R2E0_9HYPO|nr:hypothetical protein NLG97_g3107 [Lecanicillium saksenae]